MTSSQRRLSPATCSRSVSLWAISRFMSSGTSQPPPPRSPGAFEPSHGGALARLSTDHDLVARRSRRSGTRHVLELGSGEGFGLQPVELGLVDGAGVQQLLGLSDLV